MKISPLVTFEGLNAPCEWNGASRIREVIFRLGVEYPSNQ